MTLDVWAGAFAGFLTHLRHADVTIILFFYHPDWNDWLIVRGLSRVLASLCNMHVDLVLSCNHRVGLG